MTKEEAARLARSIDSLSNMFERVLEEYQADMRAALRGIVEAQVSTADRLDALSDRVDGRSVLPSIDRHYTAREAGMRLRYGCAPEDAPADAKQAEAEAIAAKRNGPGVSAKTVREYADNGLLQKVDTGGFGAQVYTEYGIRALLGLLGLPQHEALVRKGMHLVRDEDGKPLKLVPNAEMAKLRQGATKRSPQRRSKARA